MVKSWPLKTDHMKIRASLWKPDEQWRNNEKAKFIQVSLMLGYDCDETQTSCSNGILKHKGEDELETNAELFE